MLRIGIIGGSIAGLECALRLSEKQDVTIFEEHERIGEPLLCAEAWVKSFIEPYGFVDRVIDKMVVRWLDNEKMKIKGPITFNVNGSIVMLDRPAMEKHMAEMAAKKGCEIHLGKKVKIKDLVTDYDVIIDASGHPSQWDREFGQPKRSAVAVQARCNFNCNEMIIDFCKDLDGYFWIFPKKDGVANIGVGYFRWKRKNLNLRAILNRYIEIIGAKSLNFIAAPLGIGLNRPFVRFFENKPVALVGDAAGMVDQFSGEGMTKAVFAARILANCINSKGLEGLRDYESQFMEKLGWFYRMTNLIYLLRNSPFFYPLMKLLGPHVLKYALKKLQKSSMEIQT